MTTSDDNPGGQIIYDLADLTHLGFGSRPTLMKRIRSGELEARRLGSRIIVTVEAVEAMLAGLPRV